MFLGFGVGFWNFVIIVVWVFGLLGGLCDGIEVLGFVVISLVKCEIK